MLKELLRYLTRKKVTVVFNDFKLDKPVSNIFSLDRGTQIDRGGYRDKFLRHNSQYIKVKILKMGDSPYSRKLFGDDVTSYEVLHAVPRNRAATIIGDQHDPDYQMLLTILAKR